MTFAKKIPIKEFKDLTVDSERYCIILHLFSEDDCFFQLQDKIFITEKEAEDFERDQILRRDRTIVNNVRQTPRVVITELPIGESTEVKPYVAQNLESKFE